MRTTWNGSLSFGLVSIPVKIYSTAEPSQEIHFHLVHAGWSVGAGRDGMRLLLVAARCTSGMLMMGKLSRWSW